MSQDTFIPPPARKKKNTKGLSLAAEAFAPPTLDDDESLYDSSIASQLVPSRSLTLKASSEGLSLPGIRNGDEDPCATAPAPAPPKGLSLNTIPLRAAPPNPDGSKRPPAMRLDGKRADSASSKASYQAKLSERLAGLDISPSTSGGDSSEPNSAKAGPGEAASASGTSGKSTSSGKSKKEGRKKRVELKNEDFRAVRDLGAGNGGTVNLVTHVSTGLTMAKKLVLIDAKPTVRKQILRELQIMHDCSSPWIVSFYGAFLSDPHICICMEYMDKSSLDGIYKKHGAIDIEIVGKIAEAVLEGLTYLYDVHRIIHRDIKPSNILVNSEGEIKICDFGVSGELINSVANTFVGTSTYMSPERIQGSNYSVKSDVWSLGISLIELALGRFPFSDEPIDSDDDSDIRDAQNTISSAKDAIAAEARAKAKANGHSPGEGNGSQGVSLGGGGATMSILDLLQHIVNEPAPKLTPPGKFPKDAEEFVGSCLMKEPRERKSTKDLLKSPWMVYVKQAPIDVKAWAATID